MKQAESSYIVWPKGDINADVGSSDGAANVSLTIYPIKVKFNHWIGTTVWTSDIGPISSGLSY